MDASEVWKSVCGYEGRYEVSNFGNICRSERPSIKRQAIFQQAHSKGYWVVRLYDGKKYKSFYTHRLVAEAFIENPNGFPQINHIDGNKRNNHVDNLEWVTNKKNSEHAIRTGLSKVTKRCICLSDGKKFFSCADAARFYGIHPVCVSEACDGRKKSAHGKIFAFCSNNEYEQEAQNDQN